MSSTRSTTLLFVGLTLTSASACAIVSEDETISAPGSGAAGPGVEGRLPSHPARSPESGIPVEAAVDVLDPDSPTHDASHDAAFEAPFDASTDGTARPPNEASVPDAVADTIVLDVTKPKARAGRLKLPGRLRDAGMPDASGDAS